jgi:hypothetical protein
MNPFMGSEIGSPNDISPKGFDIGKLGDMLTGFVAAPEVQHRLDFVETPKTHTLISPDARMTNITESDGMILVQGRSNPGGDTFFVK